MRERTQLETGIARTRKLERDLDDAVTLADVTATALGFTAKPVAFAALGTIDKLPDYNWVNSLLK